MRLSLVQSRLIAAGVLGLFFALGILFVRRSHLPVKKTSITETPNPAIDPNSHSTRLGAANATNDQSNPVFSLKEFHRSQIEDGKVVWQVDAANGTFDPASNSATLANAHLITNDKNGDKLEIIAGAAKLFLDGVLLKQADASAGVNITFGDRINLTTDQASLNQLSGDVAAPGQVTIQSDAMLISGEVLQGNLKTKELRLLRQVSTTVFPRNRPGSNFNKK